ncbi:hypothetical protein PybrP1_007647 [[Pythium] brassicae (nom. inval.)]|nr:hypothetical protein PybrP1_007647 [[Pythium] brassicae (nom. inval.)]
MENPWGDAHATPHRVALGGLRAFVERNNLTADALARENTTSSSLELIHSLRVLLAKKPKVLALTRELEALEHQAASAGCLLPHQIRLRVESAAALRAQLQALLALKPALLHALRRSVEPEAVDVEMEHQRSFIALFLTLGDVLPRHAHTLNTLDGIALVAADLAARQHAFERVVLDLAGTIADYHALCAEISKLRGVYAHFQSDPAACRRLPLPSDTSGALPRPR